MPLPSLATVADAQYYGYTLPDDTAAAWLARASVRVRRAAGQSITSVTSTLQMPVEYAELQLPGAPITAVASVSSVEADGTVTALVQGKDWAWDGQETITFHTAVYRAEVVFTHGFVTVPDELVDLVCSVALRLSNTPVGMEAGIRSVTIDDYSRTFAAESRLDASVLIPGELVALNQILAVPSAFVVRSR